MSDERLIRYLLRDLPEGEMLQVEKEYFSDDRLEEELKALEDELMYDYLQNKLSPAQRELFEKRLLSQPRFRDRAEFAQLLISALPHSRFRVVDSSSRFMRAAVLALMLLCAWLLTDVFRLRKQLHQAKKELVSSQPVQEKTEDKAPVLAFILKPGAQRAGGAMERIMVPAGADFVQLQLELPESTPPARYIAELLLPAGAAIWSGPADSVETPSGRMAVVMLPLAQFGNDDYQLILHAVFAGGKTMEVADYSFTLLKPAQ